MVENELYDEGIEVRTRRPDGTPRLDSFFNKDGLLIRAYGWLVKNAIGIIILIHGIKAHTRLAFLRHNVEIVSNDKAILKDKDNYYLYNDSWIEHFNKKGYSVYGLDLQGHGLSDGWENLSFNIKNFDDFAYDVIHYISKIHDTPELGDKRDCIIPRSSNDAGNRDLLPVYIIGLSMGGNIALRTLQILGKLNDRKPRLNIKGCISLSGMISIEQLPSPNSYAYKSFFLPISKFVANCVPTLRLISKYPYKIYPCIKDIINFDKIRSNKEITCRFGYELLRAMYNLDKDMEHIPKDIPILFIHSKDDCLCYYGGAVSFYNRLDVDKKELHTVENMDHLLVCEPGNEEILKKIVQWLTSLSAGMETSKI
ncbi:lysophospholipase, putative [Plasmodium ovale]|uniref:Lysophospholipase, putative n=2 Tax=Plasmodium ovale TaxID=36330 RepID=A0A1A8WHK9_PLAOA|nr:lysophospholipase, putative [Plasmodium ovale curtisi]SBT02211.1 lysophospholipase, putative [Plasmodium ovale curtisi]SBT84613.1 lysophospholipase, putative [Plasmodium ovale]